MLFALTVVARVDAAVGRREAARATLVEAIEVGSVAYSAAHEGGMEARSLDAELAPPADPQRRVTLEALVAHATLPQALADRARGALGPR